MVCGRSVPVQTFGSGYVEKRVLIMWRPRGGYEGCSRRNYIGGRHRFGTLKRRTAIAAARNCQQVPGALHAHFGNQHPNETSMTALLARESLGPQRNGKRRGTLDSRLSPANGLLAA